MRHRFRMEGSRSLPARGRCEQGNLLAGTRRLPHPDYEPRTTD